MNFGSQEWAFRNFSPETHGSQPEDTQVPLRSIIAEGPGIETGKSLRGREISGENFWWRQVAAGRLPDSGPRIAFRAVTAAAGQEQNIFRQF
jgi:hypothetical protein